MFINVLIVVKSKFLMNKIPQIISLPSKRIQRFQKSIDLVKNVCGRCHGKFILLQNDKLQKQKTQINDKIFFGESTTTPVELIQTPKRLNTFAQFVKDNYNSVKIENKLSSHKDVMQEISKKFKLISTK